MHQYFVDTWYLVAFFDRTDRHRVLAGRLHLMLVMRDLGLTFALTNDHHFQQEGFVVVNE